MKPGEKNQAGQVERSPVRETPTKGEAGPPWPGRCSCSKAPSVGSPSSLAPGSIRVSLLLMQRGGSLWALRHPSRRGAGTRLTAASLLWGPFSARGGQLLPPYRAPPPSSGSPGGEASANHKIKDRRGNGIMPDTVLST